MNRAFVLNNDRKPLMPCTTQRAYQLINGKKAAIFRHVPFTIILKKTIKKPQFQPVSLKLDPGSKTTGIVVAANEKVLFAMNLEHRGQQIKNDLENRRNLRRGRRSRNLRYREARFSNRTRKEGWLPPSLQSRVDNVHSWTNKFFTYAKVTTIACETVRFDMQKMQNPEISGVEYQQGELQGYEVREYILEKFNRVCIYCDKKNVPLEIEHLTPKSRGGSNRISNLGLACHECNQAKNSMTVQEFVKDGIRKDKILRQAKSPLKDAAAVNATRNAIKKMLKKFDVETTFWTGARTKMNRIKQNYPKDHWIDAACVGESGAKISLQKVVPLKIKTMGRGTRQVVKNNAFGFPAGTAKTAKQRDGFQTGDLVRAIIRKGKSPGIHIGRISSTGKSRFDITTKNGIIGTTAKNLKMLQRNFGYALVA